MIITPILVVFMVVVFVLLVLFLNTVDKRKWLTVLISLILTPLVYFYVFYPFINIISSYHHQKYFNSENWKDLPALRYEMIDYTIASDTLIGLSKSKIEALLGKTEWLGYDTIKHTRDTNRWNYSLGIEPGAFTNSQDNLEIVFKDDRVSQLKISTEPITYQDVEN